MLHRQDNTKTQLSFPLPTSHHVTLLSVIHGVVFFAYSDNPWQPRSIAFWNPTVNRHVSAPLPPEGGNHLLIAGFDPSKNDFKAVRIPSYSNTAAAIRYYQVFSARAGAWKKREWTKTMTTMPQYCIGCCYFNGAIYWITDTNLRVKSDDDKFRYTLYEARGGRGRPHGLVFFDCSTEEFGEMELPEQVWDMLGTPRLFVYRGLLSVITRESGMSYVDMSTPCGLWTMKEYGAWTKDLILTYEGARRYDSMPMFSKKACCCLTLERLVRISNLSKYSM